MSSHSPEFPYPLITVNGAQAEGELQRLIRSGKHEGFSPVILGDAEELARIAENMEFNETRSKRFSPGPKEFRLKVGFA